MEQSVSQTRKGIFTYLGITLGLSSIFYFLLIYTGTMTRLYVLGLMWSPGMSGMLTTKLMGRNISDMGWSWKSKFQLWAYLVPLIYTAIAYLVIWISGLGGFYNPEIVTKAAAMLNLHIPESWLIAVYFILTGIYGMAGGVSSALGEEIGWRGFLTPQLSKVCSYTQTSLIVGFIWSFWHYPILIFGKYNNGTPAWFGLTCFTVMVVSSTFIYTWFRLKSGSLWTGVFIHASHNLFIQVLFTPLTKDTGITKYIVDEFGVALPIISVIFGFYYWTRRGELPAREVAAI
jgi:membrane protease YdiL (CAAX protease family)